MKNTFFALAAWLLCGSLLYAQPEGKVGLVCDIGTYLSVCTGCQQVVNADQGRFHTATLHGTHTNDWYTRFDMRRLPNGNYTFQAENGMYLSLCNGCIVGGTTPDFATFHTNDPNAPWAQFQVQLLPNGKYILRSVHNGRFLARCQGCSPSCEIPNQVTMHSTNAPNEAYAQWEIRALSPPASVRPGAVMTNPRPNSLLGRPEVRLGLKCDIGTYLSVCTGCQQVVNADQGRFHTATLHGTHTSDWYTRFTMRRLPNGNYTFQAENGMYLSLCNGCIVGGTTPDFATFHTNDPNAPWAQFEAQQLPNGKYTLRCIHNGKYLARCQGCSPSCEIPNQATMHSTNAPNEAYAQWEFILL